MTTKSKVSKSNTAIPSVPKAVPIPTPTDPVVAGIADPPAQDAPAVPSGYDPTRMTLGRGRSKVNVALVAHAAAVAKEITASTTFADDFGPRLSPTEISASMVRAVGWRSSLTKARAWEAYLTYGDSKAWEVTLVDVHRLRLAWDYLLKLDPNAAQRYPQLAALFTAVSAPATKAGKTRKANRVTKAQAEAQGLQIVEPAKKGGKVKVAQPAAKSTTAAAPASPAPKAAAEPAPPVTTGNA